MSRTLAKIRSVEGAICLTTTDSVTNAIWNGDYELGLSDSDICLKVVSFVGRPQTWWRLDHGFTRLDGGPSRWLCLPDTRVHHDATKLFPEEQVRKSPRQSATFVTSSWKFMTCIFFKLIRITDLQITTQKQAGLQLVPWEENWNV